MMTFPGNSTITVTVDSESVSVVPDFVKGERVRFPPPGMKSSPFDPVMDTIQFSGSDALPFPEDSHGKAVLTLGNGIKIEWGVFITHGVLYIISGPDRNEMAE